jgi:AcrR family transcriptional regulator
MTPASLWPWYRPWVEPGGVSRMSIQDGLLTRTADRVVPVTGKGERTRQRVLEAARVVFERDGYPGTRVADIASTAGVAHGTFYKYFESKDDVFRELTNSVVTAMFARTRQPDRAPDALTRIARANWRYIRAYREDAEFLAVVWQVAMIDRAYRDFWVQVRQHWADIIERWVRAEIRQGRADDRLDPRIAARALGLMMETFAHHWFVLGEQYDDESALTTLTQLWLNALQLEGAEGDVAAVAAATVAAS